VRIKSQSWLIRTEVKQSAGLMMYRIREGALQVFLVHPGGPFFACKDEGVWSIPKGEIEDGDSPFQVALREFEEETGQQVENCAVSPEFLPLGPVIQKNGKTVHGWAFQGDWPRGASFKSNLFEMEWPPRSGKFQKFPEVDQGEFFSLSEARTKLNQAQTAFIERLVEELH
jgi:predicted NUDIX family NTP pyrophosphohydrolase